MMTSGEKRDLRATRKALAIYTNLLKANHSETINESAKQLIANAHKRLADIKAKHPRIR